jgi:hypothetical protein
MHTVRTFPTHSSTISAPGSIAGSIDPHVDYTPWTSKLARARRPQQTASFEALDAQIIYSRRLRSPTVNQPPDPNN